MAGSPTARSLENMRSRGYTVAKVEFYSSFAKKRFDLFGFIDILCIKPKGRDIGLQTTTSSNMGARIAKIINTLEARIWLESGHRIIVHGWSKKGARGTRKIWTLDEREIIFENGEVKLELRDV